MGRRAYLGVNPSRELKNIGRVGRSLLLGTGASLICWTGGATATEMINLKYNAIEVSIQTSDLADFVETGIVPSNLEQFLAGKGNLPDILRTVLRTQLRFNPEFIRNAASSSVGEFVLMQLTQVLNNAQGNLGTLKNTIFDAVDDDNHISLLEIIQKYPVSNVNVDVSGMQNIYNTVGGFLRTIEPALNVARGILQNLLCDCQNVTANPAESTSVQPVATGAKNCLETVTPAQTEAAIETVQKAVDSPSE